MLSVVDLKVCIARVVGARNNPRTLTRSIQTSKGRAGGYAGIGGKISIALGRSTFHQIPCNRTDLAI
jgi:hypothetical protein